MILIQYFTCRCGRLKNAVNQRCPEKSHAPANRKEEARRLHEDSVRRIVERFGPAAARALKGGRS